MYRATHSLGQLVDTTQVLVVMAPLGHAGQPYRNDETFGRFASGKLVAHPDGVGAHGGELRK